MTAESVLANLHRVVDFQKDNNVLAVTEACVEVVALAKENCTPESTPYYRAPLITGNLRRNNDYEVEEQSDGSIVGVVFNNTEYAVFVHEGTSKMEARPFLYDALMAKQDEIEDLLADVVMRSFKEVR